MPPCWLRALAFAMLIRAGLSFAEDLNSSVTLEDSMGGSMSQDRMPLGLVLSNAPDDLIARLRELENDPLDFVAKRMLRDEYRNWTPMQVEEARISFLRWASFNLIPDSPSLTPTPLIDEFWHHFILYTLPYEEWCHRHFGFFLHHFPQDDDNENESGDDTQDIQRGFIEANRLMKQWYGVTLYQEDNHDDADISIGDDESRPNSTSWSSPSSSPSSCSKCQPGKCKSKLGGCSNCKPGHCKSNKSSSTSTTSSSASCGSCGSGKCKSSSSSKKGKSGSCGSCGSGKCKSREASTGLAKSGNKSSGKAGSCGSCGSGKCKSSSSSNSEKMKKGASCGSCKPGQRLPSGFN